MTYLWVVSQLVDYLEDQENNKEDLEAKADLIDLVLVPCHPF
jgi:hypothetical protein